MLGCVSLASVRASRSKRSASSGRRALARRQDLQRYDAVEPALASPCRPCPSRRGRAARAPPGRAGAGRSPRAGARLPRPPRGPRSPAARPPSVDAGPTLQLVPSTRRGARRVADRPSWSFRRVRPAASALERRDRRRRLRRIPDGPRRMRSGPLQRQEQRPQLLLDVLGPLHEPSDLLDQAPSPALPQAVRRDLQRAAGLPQLLGQRRVAALGRIALQERLETREQLLAAALTLLVAQAGERRCEERRREAPLVEPLGRLVRRGLARVARLGVVGVEQRLPPPVRAGRGARRPRASARPPARARARRGGAARRAGRSGKRPPASSTRARSPRARNPAKKPCTRSAASSADSPRRRR